MAGNDEPTYKFESETESVLQSVSNAIRILEAFDDVHPEMGATELSQRLGLHKSVVYRLLRTLEAHGWVHQQDNKKYRLSLRVFEVGLRAVGRLGLGAEIQPFLEDLAHRTGDTVNVGVIDGRDVMYVNKVTPDRPLRVEVRVGVRMPVHCTAMGKLLLAYASQEERDAFMKVGRFPGMTSRTIESPEELKKVLERVREQGYASSEGELFEEICCVAAPIRDFAGQVVAALSIATHSQRYTPERYDWLVGEVKQTADLISRKIGYAPGR